MVDQYYPGKYLEEITNRCRRLTVNEMLRNVEETIRNNRMGFGHYLFDGAHAPRETWSPPGALDYELEKDGEAFEVTFRTGPFDKGELTVHVEEGSLQVEALHEDVDQRGGRSRKVRVVKHVPLPFEFDLEEVEARFSDKVLVVRIPQTRKPRRKVEIL